MDDRTIIDDDSMRITDVMQAKPGDLMVLGNSEYDSMNHEYVFKQKAWLVITAVHDHKHMFGRDGICIEVSNFKLFVQPMATRGIKELFILTEDPLDLRCTGLYFDCLIRQKPHHKKGIYKNKYTSDVIYFDGKGSFNFLNDPADVSKALLVEPFLDFDQYTLVYAFDEDDDHGEKNI